MNVRNTRLLIDAVRSALRERPPGFLSLTEYFGHRDAGRSFSTLYGLTAWLEETGADACGTTMCLAGLCQMTFAATEEERLMPAHTFAKWWLDLDLDEAGRLFFGDWDELPDERRGRFTPFMSLPTVNVTPAEAIAHLEAMVEQAATPA